MPGITILPTQNPEWGFYGTSADNRREDTPARRTAYALEQWHQANLWLQQRWGLTPEEARAWLDSRHGRHLADALTAYDLDWIAANWNRWIAKSIPETATQAQPENRHV